MLAGGAAIRAGVLSGATKAFSQEYSGGLLQKAISLFCVSWQQPSSSKQTFEYSTRSWVESCSGGRSGARLFEASEALLGRVSGFRPQVHTQRARRSDNGKASRAGRAQRVWIPPWSRRILSAGSMVHALHFGQNLSPSNMPTVCAMCFDCGFSTFTLAQNELLGLKEACTKAGAMERN
jgi:hypothetical protein